MICFVCGKRLVQAVTHKPLEGVDRLVGGNPVKMHKCCAEGYDKENRRVTAAAATSEDGRTFVDGVERANSQGEVFKLMRPKGGG